MNPAQKVIIYTDGAALGNPGPGGYGVVMLYGEKRKEISEGYKHTTNNRMELLAVIVALEHLKKENLHGFKQSTEAIIVVFLVIIEDRHKNRNQVLDPQLE